MLKINTHQISEMRNVERNFKFFSQGIILTNCFCFYICDVTSFSSETQNKNNYGK